MLSDIVCPPQSWDQFLAQTYFDEEYLRKSAGGVNYVRGKHGGFDNQDVFDDRELMFVGFGEVRHVDFGPYLGRNQFVLRFEDNSGYFYAHTASRRSQGAIVQPGTYAGLMGNSSSLSIGVHLHHEYLEQWNVWESCRNAGPRLRELKAQMGALSDSDKDFIRKAIDNRLAPLKEELTQEIRLQVLAATKALADGTNDPNTDRIPDGFPTKDFNLKKIDSQVS